MTHVMKKVGIAIMVAIFVATMCLSMMVLPSKAYADSVPYAIGDTGPAGGIIFYVSGSYCLEAAPSDQGTSEAWSNITATEIGVTAQGQLIGTGQANTNAIIAQGATSGAARICDDLILGGYSDWFLPSRYELEQMYVSRVAIGGFQPAIYWSSSETNATDARIKFFSDGASGNSGKTGTYYVRAIRAFTGMKGTGSAAEKPWVRTMPMTCYRVWINEDNKFQFIFWYPYRDNNWVKIYDMSGKEVFSINMPYNNPNLIVDLPNGMYTVKTFTAGSTSPIQTFVIGK